jgi:hypothetical protein
MITSRQILEAIDIIKMKSPYLPEDSTLLISINPSSLSQCLIDLKDDVRNPEFIKDSKLLRFDAIPAAYGNVLRIWCGYRATHDEVGTPDIRAYHGNVSYIGYIDALNKTYAVCGNPNHKPDSYEEADRLDKFIISSHLTKRPEREFEM